MSNPVVSIKRKANGATKREWPGDLVGASDDWLVVFYQHLDHETEAGETVAYALGYFGVGQPLVVLISFDERGQVLEYQCDAALPPQRLGNEIRWIDLDMDLMSGPELVPHIRDFDDFARNSKEMGYDAAAIAAASDGINLALSLLLARAYPFDGSPAALLGSLLATEG